MTKPGTLQDRALGALLGLAVGDALGTTLEFAARDSRPPVTDIVGGGPFGLEPGTWTDDTSMALCLADSLLHAGTLDPHDLMHRFVRWWRHGENSVTGTCFDIGNTTRAALQRFLKTGDPFAGDSHPRSAGNGSIMRLAPVVLRWHHDAAQTSNMAAEQSRTTHAAPAAIAGCRFLAEVLVDAIRTGDKTAALRPRAGDEPTLAAVAGGTWRSKKRHEVVSSGYVVHTLEAACWAVHNAADFREALVLAVNLADDADTVGAVTGQIAGALWGLTGIPPNWIQRLAWGVEIRKRAEHLIVAGSQFDGHP